MEHQIYMQGIKKSLKARGISYQQLAEQLGMSESGVKKMLTAKDISFRRILQICECLGILPGALLGMAEKTSIAEVHLSPEQEEALLKNRHLLMAFWCLVIEKRSPQEIEKTQKITPPELKKLLNRLVTLGLLSERKGLYRPQQSGKFRWSDQSRLAKHLNQEWSQLTLTRALDTQRPPGTLHRLITMRLTKTSFESFQQKITDLWNEAIQTSEREESQSARKDLKNLSAVVALLPQGIFDT